ncbi:unnamed protein product [Peronospora destructor]|uniref:Uncharacterized protein n=1 Tax=Peronospora destructor TaxID=86335 RepID=A0AAV0UGU3_9STRA|nr:unnamed protein product [Peronospora destructor]
MANTQTLDLFDGLPLDYNFLESGDASADVAMNTNSRAPACADGFVGSDDQMLLDSDVPGSSHTYTMTPTRAKTY